MKTLLRGIGYVAIVIAALCVLFIAINWGDEPLRPEVQAALDWKVPDNAFDDNGYLIMLGMNEPAGQDASAVGKQMVEADLAGYQAYLHSNKAPEPMEPPHAIDFKDKLCNTTKEKNCVEFYLAQDANKQSALLKDYRYVSDRYRAVRQSKNFVEVWPPFAFHSIPGYANLMNAAKLEHIQAISEISNGNPRAGVDRLVEAAQFSRRLLKESDTLITHMIALAMVKTDVRILSELLGQYPALARYREQLAPVVAPISGPEYSLARAFQGERHIFLPQLHANLQDLHAMLRESREKEEDESLSGTSGVIVDKVQALGLRRNATVNLAYDFWELRLKLAAADASRLDDELVTTRQEEQRLLGWGYANFLYPRNPVGKILVLISNTSYEDYLFKQHDHEGYVRLVALQVKLIADHVPAQGMPDALEKSGPELRNPYTLKPMEWDAASSELRFQGRQGSGKEPNKKYLYAVKIPRGEP